jgi:ketosteroid isomerase-like protein
MSRRAQPSRSSLILALLLLLSLAALQAQPPGGPHHGGRQARQQIESLEEQWRAATLAGDTSAMDKMLSDDYVGISWTGQVNTKAMQLDRTSKRTVVISKMDLTDIKVKLLGPVAVVTSRAEIEGTNDGKEISGGFRYTRVYQRIPGGGWQITNFEATRIPPGHDHRGPDAPGS